MKTLTVTEVARNFSSAMDEVAENQEEIVLVRYHKPIARLVPEHQDRSALEILGDLYGTLDDKTAEAVNSGRKGDRGALNELQNTWAT